MYVRSLVNFSPSPRRFGSSSIQKKVMLGLFFLQLLCSQHSMVVVASRSVRARDNSILNPILCDSSAISCDESGLCISSKRCGFSFKEVSSLVKGLGISGENKNQLLDTVSIFFQAKPPLLGVMTETSKNEYRNIMEIKDKIFELCGVKLFGISTIESMDGSPKLLMFQPSRIDEIKDTLVKLKVKPSIFELDSYHSFNENTLATFMNSQKDFLDKVNNGGDVRSYVDMPFSVVDRFYWVELLQGVLSGISSADSKRYALVNALIYKKMLSENGFPTGDLSKTLKNVQKKVFPGKTQEQISDLYPKEIYQLHKCEFPDGSKRTVTTRVQQF